MNQTIALNSLKKLFGIWAVALLSMASSCSHLSVTQYDNATVDALNGLKPEVNTVYDGFSADTVNTTATNALSSKIQAAVHYEEGKGQGNKDTFEQFKTIKSMFERHVKDRTAEGKWTTTYIAGKKSNILGVIDAVIQTENLKNKRE